MDKNKALSKCMDMCSKREYCSAEISEKLQKWELTEPDIDQIIESLIAQKFIDHERYATAFVNDKIRFNHWGKVKVKYYLNHKGIEGEIINIALKNFSENKYIQIALTEIEKKWNKTTAKNAFELKNKVAKSIINKGFEPALVFELLKTIENDK